MSRTVRFTDLEEAVYNIERAFVPWNIQFELGTDGHVDLERLEAAAERACEVHPLARAGRKPHSENDTGYVWEIPASVESVPVETADGDDPAALAESQRAFYRQPFDLRDPPPFRLLVARSGAESGGDRVLLSMSHVPADGVSTYRLVRSICRAYRGLELDADPVSLAESRAVLEEYRPSPFDDRVSLLTTVTKRLGNTVDPPARIAPEGSGDRDGWGFVHRTVDPEVTAALVGERPAEVSVNDVLLAALHLAIADWNDDHGRSTNKVTTLMPVNLRPDDWFYQVVGMYALFVTVSTRRPNREDPRSAVERVARQTTSAKTHDREAGIYELLDAVPDGTPVGLKQKLPELLRGPGNRLLDSAVLSNLGRVEPLPGLDGTGTDELWFSPPCWGPMRFGIGVVTVGDTVRVTFRYERAHFDRDGAAAFADRYLDALAAAVTDVAAPA